MIHGKGISRVGACALLACLAVAEPAQAASFDCSKAQTKVEKSLCASEELSQADDALDLAYQWALARTDNPQELAQKQRHWLKTVRNACQPLNEACLSTVMEDRTKELTALARGNGCYTLEPNLDDERGKLRPAEPVCEVLEQNLNQFCDQPPMVNGFKIAPGYNHLLQVAEWTPLDPQTHRGLIETFVRASWVDARHMTDAEKDERWEKERPALERAMAENRISFSQAQVDLYNLGKKQTAYRLDYGKGNYDTDDVKSWRKLKTAPVVIQHAPEIVASLFQYMIEGRVDMLGEVFTYDSKTYSYWPIGEYTRWRSPPFDLKFNIFRNEFRKDPGSEGLMLRRDRICTFNYRSKQEAR